MKLPKFITINRDFIFYPDRLAEQLTGFSGGKTWLFFAFKVGWLPMVLLVWIGAQAIITYMDLPLHYPDYFWESMVNDWRIETAHNFGVVFRYSCFPFLIYLLILAPIMGFYPSFFSPFEEKRNYVILFWAYGFSGAFLAPVGLKHQEISYFVVMVLTSFFLSNAVIAGDLIPKNKDTPRSDSDKLSNVAAPIMLLYFWVVWVIYGLAARYFDEIQIKSANWWLTIVFATAFISLLLTPLVIGLIKLLAERKFGNSYSNSLSVGVLIWSIMQVLQLPMIFCLLYWGALSFKELFMGIGFSALVWFLCYYRVANWLYIEFYLHSKTDIYALIQLRSNIPIFITNERLNQVIEESPQKAMAVGNFFLEHRTPLQRSIAVKLIQKAARKMPEKDIATTAKINLILSKVKRRKN